MWRLNRTSPTRQHNRIHFLADFSQIQLALAVALTSTPAHFSKSVSVAA
jgi:hypothetical protein